MEKNKNINEIIDTMFVYCLKHSRPILRQKAMEVFGLQKKDIKKMEIKGLIKIQPLYIRTANGRQQTAMGIIPIKYLEHLEKEKKRKILESNKKEAWSKVSKWNKIMYWILKKLGLKTSAQRLYDNLSNTVLSI